MAEKKLSKFGQWMYDLCDRWGMFLKDHIWLYWVLSFTWSIITTIMGLVVSALLIMIGKKPQKYHGIWYVEVGGPWGGLEMGICFLIGKGCEGCRKHEFGHVFAQTSLLGPFMLLVMAASGIRYWYIQLRYYNNKERPPFEYDDIWFERSATQTGGKLVKYFDNVCKVEEAGKEAKEK